MPELGEESQLHHHRNQVLAGDDDVVERGAAALELRHHRLVVLVEVDRHLAGELLLETGDDLRIDVLAPDEEVEPALTGSILDESVADLNVLFRRGKVDAELDQKQGRLVIEQHLLDYAGITKEIVAVRAGAYWRVLRPNHPEL